MIFFSIAVDPNDKGKKPVDDKGKRPVDDYEEEPIVIDYEKDEKNKFYMEWIPFAYNGDQACRRLHTKSIFDSTVASTSEPGEYDLDSMTHQKALWISYMWDCDSVGLQR